MNMDTSSRWIFGGDKFNEANTKEISDFICKYLIAHIVEYRQINQDYQYNRVSPLKLSGKIPRATKKNLQGNFATMAFLNNQEVIANNYISCSLNLANKMFWEFIRRIRSNPHEASTLVQIYDKNDDFLMGKLINNEYRISILVPDNSTTMDDRTFKLLKQQYDYSQEKIDEEIKKIKNTKPPYIYIEPRYFLPGETLNKITVLSNFCNFIDEIIIKNFSFEENFKGYFPSKEGHDDKIGDAERLLLNAADYLITSDYLKKDITKIILFSEIVPCESCTSIMINFCKKYPNIELVVSYNQSKESKCYENSGEYKLMKILEQEKNQLSNFSILEITSELFNVLQAPELLWNKFGDGSYLSASKA